MTPVLIIGGGGIAEAIKRGLGAGTVVLERNECDVRYYEDVESQIDYWNPRIVICTAGVSHVVSVLASDPTLWSEELEVNLLGAYHVARASVIGGVRTMIFLASVAGKYGKPNHSGYSASKAGVISLVQSLAMEGRDAYAISPGRVDTPMREHDYPGEDPRTRLETAEIAEVVNDIILHRYEPGSNIIIRRIGHETQPIRIDDGEPWKTDLRVGQPPAV